MENVAKHMKQLVFHCHVIVPEADDDEDWSDASDVEEAGSYESGGEFSDEGDSHVEFDGEVDEDGYPEEEDFEDKEEEEEERLTEYWQILELKFEGMEVKAAVYLEDPNRGFFTTRAFYKQPQSDELESEKTRLKVMEVVTPAIEDLRAALSREGSLSVAMLQDIVGALQKKWEGSYTAETFGDFEPFDLWL